MPYEDPYQRPASHYVVVVQVKEVTPAHTTGTGSQKERHEREVDDLLSLSVQRTTEEDAARTACQMIEQWAGFE
jgi:hypothetical protein